MSALITMTITDQMKVLSHYVSITEYIHNIQSTLLTMARPDVDVLVPRLFNIGAPKVT